MIMAMLTQAFRYAYEPFVFGKSRDKDSKIIYAQAMKYFIISHYWLFGCYVLFGYIEIHSCSRLLDRIAGGTYCDGG